MSRFRAALDPPPEAVVEVSTQHIETALRASRESPRKRVILPFHKSDEDPLHRMLNAAQPGTYVQPHRHASVPRAEVFLVLRGACDVVLFDDDGRVTRVLRLRAGSERFGADLGPGVFHTFLAREPDTVLYEIKCGPYTKSTAKDFAAWAPKEGSSEVDAYLAGLEREIAALSAR
jgi:cupin fold WbuC family metalloprotein